METDAVKILHKRYVGDDPVRQKELEIARLENRIEVLEDVLRQARATMSMISQKGHLSGYDWNADTESLTLLEGEMASKIEMLLSN